MQFKGTGSLLVKDLDTKRGVVQAYWSAFGNKDDQGDIVEPGCWRKSIKERGPGSRQARIKFLFQHQETMLLGKPSELVEDSFGLLATCQIVPTTLGKDCLLLYEAGVLAEHSVGYETVLSKWDSKSGARLLQECVLWEGSAVTWGANSETSVVAIKSLSDPARLTTLANNAAALDSLLHTGRLQSDALCATLERELKSLHAALAPTREAASQPYTIEGVLAGMNDLTERLTGTAVKAASDDDKKAQEARAKKYGIGVKDGGSVTKPGAWKDLADSDFGDPVNYRYPLPDKEHADNAAARFAAPTARAQYTADEQDIIAKRIIAKQKSFGEDNPDWWPIKDGKDGNDADKGADMDKRLIKSADGDVEVSADGTHAAFTGTHTHSHKAMGSQGGDDQHEHEHTHDGDAKHDHEHMKAAATAPATAPAAVAASTPPKARQAPTGAPPPAGRPVRKARDFDTLFASLNAADQLQDDWGDTFIAFTHAMSELMWQASAQTNGWTPDGAEPVDITEAAQANLDAFSKAVLGLVARSVAADFAPCLDYDGDQFLDPDGVNADDDDDDDGWKSRGGRAGHAARSNPLAAPIAMPQAMPDAPAPLRKAGRAISSANRQVITDALDGMSEAMKAMKAHHSAIADLMTKTDPDAVRQDEDDIEGDSDTENGGHDINDGYPLQPKKAATGRRIDTPISRRSAASGNTGQAATTHRETDTLDLSALNADFDALKSRLLSHAGHASNVGHAGHAAAGR